MAAVSAKAKRSRAARSVESGEATRPEIFTTPQAARYLGVSEATLRFWRANGEGPKYFRAGDRLIRYRRVDLDKYIESRLS
ncbi:MAG: helix-turn-helix domain-containing protein [Candidatus Sulfotelmatobacter sp.]|jgi:excisionase family DNA binding protein